jgi:hypothetical protein
MKKKHYPKYTWDAHYGFAECTILVDGMEISGSAYCAKEDREFMSEKVGMELAEKRAIINGMKYTVKYNLLPQIKVLKQVLQQIESSKKFNPQNYEYKMIRRQLKIKEADMAEFKRQIADLEAYIKSYIRIKDDVHKRLRSIRDKK